MAILPLINMTLARRTFHCAVGAAGTGITVPIYSTTSPTFALWNPLGTNRIAVLNYIGLTVAATATPAITGLALSEVVNTGGSFGTGLPVAAWTDATVYNARLGPQPTGGNSARVGVATTTLTTAGNTFMDLGIGQATTSLAGGLTTTVFNFQNLPIVALDPGTLIHLVGNPVAPVETFVASICWTEFDYVP